MKQLLQFSKNLFAIAILVSPLILKAQPASVTWLLTSNQKVSETAGPLIGEDQTLSGMKISNYSFQPGGLDANSQLTTINSDYWPAESEQNDGRYIQFVLSVKPGITFSIDAVSMYYAGRGGHEMKINIACSTDSTFKNFVQLNPASKPVAISDNTPTLAHLKYNPKISITYGRKLYLRIFPWYTLNLTTKYVCLQNVIISGTTSGEVIPVPPIISTAPVSHISTESAVCGGSISFDGDSPVTERGICWNATGNPTISDFKTADTTGLNNFICRLTGLDKSTKYYVRAYAKNSAGTGYGKQDSLVTLSVLTVPDVFTGDSIIVTGTSAAITGEVISGGGLLITERGFCYNNDGNPDVNSSKSSSGGGEGKFEITLFGLSGGTKYFVRAYAVNSIGTAYGEVREFTIPEVLNGAYADGIHYDTQAIQAAIDSCSLAGGGTVKLINGIYYTAPFVMKSNVTLQVDGTAKILGSTNRYDYYPAGFDTTGGRLPSSLTPLISSNYADNITINGFGTIDGNGKQWWDAFRAAPSGTPDLRPWLIILKRANKITVEDITLTNSPKFHLAPQWSKDVLIRNIRILAPENAPNTDGIDPATCHGVKILDCYIDTGDDNVAIKSGNDDPNNKNAASSDILISGCTFLHGHGVSIGSETNGGVDSMLVENCTFNGTDNGIRIKSYRTRGGNVRGVTYRNLTMNNVGYPILFSEYYPDIPSDSDPAQPVTSKTPYFHDITVENMTATNCPRAGLIIGLPETPMKNIVLKNVNISAVTGMRVRNAGIEMISSSIKTSSGAPILYEKGGVVTGIGENETGKIETEFRLMQNYPNPCLTGGQAFNPETTIKFSIPSTVSMGVEKEHAPSLRTVSLKVYDILGREVTTLVNENKSPGEYEVKFNAAGLPSGVYVYRLVAGNFFAVRKLILIK